MKVVIFAGGLGTRLSEETGLIPKPMVPIGGRPILWHIMKMYSHYGYDDFVILTGYLSHVIKDYFINYYTRYSDITVNMTNNSVEIHKTRHEPWKVTMLYTGEDSMTGARLKQAQDFLNNEPFMLTYGDGVSNLDLAALLQTHTESKRILTMTSVQPQGRFGALLLNEDNGVESFQEKPKGDGHWINGGFMVCQPEVFSYIPDNDDSVVFEQSPLQNLAKDKQLGVYKHYGFWQAMDTLKDKNDLTDLWKSQNAPWVTWDNKAAK